MEEAKAAVSTNTAAAGSAAAPNPTLTQQQQHLFQQQLFLLHQYQQHQQHHHQQQQQQSQSQQSQQSQQPQPQPQPQQQHSILSLQQQQQAMSRFPSNIDAHLRAPGLRSLHLLQQQQQQQQHQAHPASVNSSASASVSAAHHLQLQQQQQQQQAKAAAAAAVRQGGNPVEVEMAHQDAMKVCNPDVKRPFASIEDAVIRLLPYHVVSDFEAEEDDRILDSDTTGQVPSRLQQWDHNILAKIAEFTTTFEKQVLAFNIMSRKRALGDFRSEERQMIEQALLQEEKQAILEIRAEMDLRERANREATEAKMRLAMAQQEHARAEAQVQAEMMARVPPMRANAIGSHGDDGSGGQDLGPDQGGNVEMIHGWGNCNSNNTTNNNGQRDDEEPSDDFLNDENEPDNDEEAGSQEEWGEAGELDLNTR